MRALILPPAYRRDAAAHPPLDSPEYGSTRLRHPLRAPVPLTQTLTELTGPLLGEGRVGPLDHDLTRQHDGEPLGERIIVHGRVLEEDGRPVPATLRRALAVQQRRPLPARRRPPPSAAGSELQRGWALPDRRRRRVPLRHDQARRLPLGQPSQRMATSAHPLLALRPRVHAAAGDADVLPRRPAVRPGPDLQLGARSAGARAAGRRVRPRGDPAGVGAGLSLGHRAARARGDAAGGGRA